MQPNQQQQPNQPVYYDANGQPIYAQPPQTPVAPQYAPVAQQTAPMHSPAASTSQSYDPQTRIQYANEPQVIHTTRPFEPVEPVISEELRKRHEASKKEYPHLNLSEGEVVIMNLQRHPIGLFMPLASGGLVALILIGALIFYPTNPEVMNLPSYGLFASIVGLLLILASIGTYVAVWVYLRNQFFMTNESVIQELQFSLFSKREQTVSLGSIEDASFRKHGILQSMLDYGTVRLSTEGEETTYIFHYAENPREQVAILNNGVEAFKNGRPVELRGYED